MTIKHVSKQMMSAFSLALLLSACGGGDDADSPTDSPGTGTVVAAPDAQIVAYLESGNIDFIPGANGRPDGTWRWPETPDRHIVVYLPPPAAGNATETDYANKVTTSVNLLNAKLSGLLALDLTSTRPANGNFIQVSYLTSYVPPGSTDYASYCANVATGPNIGSMVVPDASNSIASGPVYINLASFGDAPVNSWASAYFDVLATLYGNPQSTSAANIVVKRAKN